MAHKEYLSNLAEEMLNGILQFVPFLSHGVFKSSLRSYAVELNQKVVDL